MVLSEAIRFVSSELGNVSEVASLSDLAKMVPRPDRATIQPRFAALLRESTGARGAAVEQLSGTVKRFALAVHFAR